MPAASARLVTARWRDYRCARFRHPGPGYALSILSYFVISIGYGILCEWAWRGQTVGKRMFRLRVVDAEGLRLQFNQVVTRNLLRAVDSLPFLYFIGGTVCWFSPRCQRLGDIAANTIVVRHLRQREPDLDQIMAGKYNSLRQYPASGGALAPAHFAGRSGAGSAGADPARRL